MSDQLFNQALTVLDQAKAVRAIKDDYDYNAVGQFIVGAKRLIAKIKDAHKPSIQTTHEAHKAAIDLCESHIQPINAALRIVEPLALAYKAKKNMEAKVQADAERQAKEAKILAEAQYLETMGFSDEAVAMVTEFTAPTRQVPVTSTLPKIEGLSTRKRWTYRIINPRVVKRDYCIPSESAIKIHVDQAFYKISQVTLEMIKQLEDEVGGIEVFEQETMVGRTK